MTENKCVWNGITDCSEDKGILIAEICLECLANRLCKLEKEGD
jgi:hypothetical protein